MTRLSTLAVFAALLLIIQPLTGQETVPGNIVPDEPASQEAEVQEETDLEEESTSLEQEDAESEEDAAASEADAQAEESNQEEDSSAEENGDPEDDQEMVNSSVNMDFLYDGSLPASISQMRAMENHIAELAEQCKLATVNIQCAGAQGSGVVVSRDGYILTAAHVISRPRLPATITFPDGSTVKAQTLGVHHSNIDSGMLKITDEGRWPYLDIGESESLEPGQWVMAIGHPGGMDEDRGLVVRVGRIIDNETTVLRTDCTLVGGDSGGPLFDMDGNVIGIHSRIGGSLQDNFHVPIDIFSEEWDDLAAGKRIGVRARPWLGLRVVDETNEIEFIDENGPAGEAGLEVGDFIIKIDDRDIEDQSDIATAMRNVKPGDTIKVVVTREEEEMEFEFETAER
ncbi:MAG: trypsin-like peptidase domain-containing protein [Planctomycetota bacterium]